MLDGHHARRAFGSFANRWLREHASHYGFVKRSVSRFMPGERLEDAIAAALELKKTKYRIRIKRTSEKNVSDPSERTR